MNVVKLCGGGADGGPASLGFTPSNFNPTTVVSGGVDWSQAPPVTDDLPAATVTIAMNDANATQADLYVLKSWAVTATKPITISGPRPAIVLVLTTVDIQGTIWVTAGGFQPGAAPGPGGGQSGGGGGSYCGIGGAGGSMVAPFPMGGSTYGNATLSPLLGGSAGASENCGGYSAGGGAIQIVAGASIAVRQYASINAGGSGGACSSAGGSGGAILLEAPTIQIAGNVAANGGAGATANSYGANATANGNPALGGNAGNDGGLSVGGNGSSRANINGGNGLYGSDGNSGGGGGTGRIRINTKTGSATVSGGTVSPALGGQDGGAGSAAGCATQGTISP